MKHYLLPIIALNIAISLMACTGNESVTIITTEQADQQQADQSKSTFHGAISITEASTNSPVTKSFPVLQDDSIIEASSKVNTLENKFEIALEPSEEPDVARVSNDMNISRPFPKAKLYGYSLITHKDYYIFDSAQTSVILKKKENAEEFLPVEFTFKEISEESYNKTIEESFSPYFFYDTLFYEIKDSATLVNFLGESYSAYICLRAVTQSWIIPENINPSYHYCEIINFFNEDSLDLTINRSQEEHYIDIVGVYPEDVFAYGILKDGQPICQTINSSEAKLTDEDLYKLTIPDFINDGPKPNYIDSLQILVFPRLEFKSNIQSDINIFKEYCKEGEEFYFFRYFEDIKEAIDRLVDENGNAPKGEWYAAKRFYVDN